MLEMQNWDQISRALALKKKDTCRRIALAKEEIFK